DMKLSGIAHITGGGLMRNIKRILPNGRQAHISCEKWEIPPVFMRLKELGKITRKEMFSVFNMGIGMVIIVPPNEEKRILKYFSKKKETVFSIGKIVRGEKRVVIN
ncbi:MAG: phosphoribosylformylglycinamidine cyclo-ligase, partial [Candidatus Omnitrophica bacterium]|nr:phosphoribosylformylglycinamidine cyclo-ligase [Candidatus Omnitrophota bacterium]